MMKFQFKQSKELLLTTHAGLASVGVLLAHTDLTKRLNKSKLKGMEFPLHSHGDVMKSYLGLLRQRLDAAAQTLDVNWNEVLLQESATLIRKIDATVTNVEAGEYRYIPLDIDISPFDNSGTKKEDVSRTYKGVDGYAPIFSYLGQEGDAVNTELREGSTHSQNGAACRRIRLQSPTNYRTRKLERTGFTNKKQCETSTNSHRYSEHHLHCSTRIPSC